MLASPDVRYTNPKWRKKDTVRILITGSNGFIGRNLRARLKCIQSGKDHTHPQLKIDEICEWTRATTEEEKRNACRHADFVFHFAGVNRPRQGEEYRAGNLGLTQELLQLLLESKNVCPVMLASSAQASLCGRYTDSDYGKSKCASEEAVFRHATETGAKSLVYRFPNVFGKWCRPNYNSAVATFCHNIAHDLPVQVNDPATELELLYIDDLVSEMLDALEDHAHRCDYDGLTPQPNAAGRYCYVPVTHRATLGEIVRLLETFNAQPETLLMPEIPDGSFAKKLYSTYLSYLPKEKTAFPLKMNADARGSFTELLKTQACGQFSLNISKPGITKGQHWHNSKWELFIVVSGHGLIQERNLNTGEVMEFEVSGEKIEAVQMLPGWTHNIINLSETDNLVTVMWANELFDPNHPDTYFEVV